MFLWGCLLNKGTLPCSLRLEPQGPQRPFDFSFPKHPRVAWPPKEQTPSGRQSLPGLSGESLQAPKLLITTLCRGRVELRQVPLCLGFGPSLGPTDTASLSEAALCPTRILSGIQRP